MTDSSTTRGTKTYDLIKVMALLEIEKAYIAGFVDGEGLIGLYEKRKDKVPYSVCSRINVSQDHPDVLIWMQSVFGGALTKITRHSRNDATYFIWTLENTMSCKLFVSTILNYLRIKQEQAETMLLWIENKSNLSLPEQLDLVKLISDQKRSKRHTPIQQLPE